MVYIQNFTSDDVNGIMIASQVITVKICAGRARSLKLIVDTMDLDTDFGFRNNHHGACPGVPITSEINNSNE